MPALRIAFAGTWRCLLAAAAIVALGEAQAQAAGVSRPRTTMLLVDSQAAKDALMPTDSCKQGGSVVGCAQPDTQMEPSIAIDPNDPRHAVTTYQQGRYYDGGDAGNGYAATFDAGRAWVHGNLPGLTTAVGGPWLRSSDATVAFSSDGWVYSTGDALNPSTGATGIAFWRSHDGGRSWSQPVIVYQDDHAALSPLLDNDKSWLAVDNSSAPGHHPGRIYVAWYRLALGLLLVAYSDDHGATWTTTSVPVPSVVTPAGAWDPTPVVLASGALAVFFNDGGPGLLPSPTNGDIRMVLDPLAGSTPTGAPLAFPTSSLVAQWNYQPLQGERSDPTFAVATAPTGRIYVAWADSRFHSDGVNDIVLTRSDDSGMTWSTPTRVNNDATNSHDNHWMAMLGVGPDGTVDVAYREREELTPSSVDSTGLQASDDGGASFSAPLAFMAPHADLGYAAAANNDAAGTPTLPFLGDYSVLAAGGDLVYVARAEAVQTTPSEPAKTSPIYHHQRIWVAVVKTY